MPTCIEITSPRLKSVLFKVFKVTNHTAAMQYQYTG